MLSIRRTENALQIAAPFHPNLPARAKDLGGKWNSEQSAWVFDRRDEARVEELYRSIYGLWEGEAVPIDAVTIRLTARCNLRARRSGIFAAGRKIARATSRDSGAYLGDGVILLEGAVSSGGSRINWETRINAGTVVEIKDVSAAKVGEINRHSWQVDVLGDFNQAALTEEKHRLTARLAEIEALMSGHPLL